MGLLFAIAFFMAMLLCPSVVICIIGNIYRLPFYLLKDLYQYFRYKKGRLVRTGEIIAFIGLFGRGKTLSAVHKICSIYRAKNGLRVYCPRRKKWVKQVVHIVSNVHIAGIPYEHLDSLKQVVMSTDSIRDIDDANDTLTVTLVLIDEAGSELNSRAFRDNIDPLLLNSILTCRHWNISIIYTAQRFGHVDALLRQVTRYVISCEKVWRFQFQKKYDAWELEQAATPANVACKAILCWFVRDRDYKAYDTYSCVDKLKKDMKDGKMLSQEEILALRVNPETVNMDGVNYSKAYKRRHKKLY